MCHCVPPFARNQIETKKEKNYFQIFRTIQNGFFTMVHFSSEIQGLQAICSKCLCFSNLLFSVRCSELRYHFFAFPAFLSQNPNFRESRKFRMGSLANAGSHNSAAFGENAIASSPPPQGAGMPGTPPLPQSRGLGASSVVRNRTEKKLRAPSSPIGTQIAENACGRQRSGPFFFARGFSPPLDVQQKKRGTVNVFLPNLLLFFAQKPWATTCSPMILRQKGSMLTKKTGWWFLGGETAKTRKTQTEGIDFLRG